MRYCIAPKKKVIMETLNIADIEKQAREMRAEEMRRIQGLMGERIALYFRLLAGSVAEAGGALRPLFSWNPQDARSGSRASGPALLARASLTLRALFSWNPQAHRS